MNSNNFSLLKEKSWVFKWITNIYIKNLSIINCIIYDNLHLNNYWYVYKDVITYSAECKEKNYSCVSVCEIWLILKKIEI